MATKYDLKSTRVYIVTGRVAMSGSTGSDSRFAEDGGESPISASNTGDVNAINLHKNNIVIAMDWCAISVGFI